MTFLFKDLTQLDPVEGFEILNTLQPEFLKSKYPYDQLSKEKVLFTKKKIEILSAKIDEYKQKPMNLLISSSKNQSSKIYGSSEIILNIKGGYNFPMVIYG
jgi:hypothetical protein